MENLTKELLSLFYDCFPYTVRDEGTAARLLGDPQNVVLEHRENGILIGALVLHKNNVLMLAVAEEFRGRGIGGKLLAEAERITADKGYDEISVGVGEDYLTPGVPTGKQVYAEKLRIEAIYPGADDQAAKFFAKRGYYHAEDNANIFDMRLAWDEYRKPPIVIGESYQRVRYRFASKQDKEAIRLCTDDAEPPFTKYYMNDYLYADQNQHVLLAEAGEEVVGVLMVQEECEAKGLGSVGCTAVKTAYRGRGIATMMVMLGTGYLKERGMESAYLGYTYSALDKLYGASGYRICIYYFMAHKKLK